MKKALFFAYTFLLRLRRVNECLSYHRKLNVWTIGPPKPWIFSQSSSNSEIKFEKLAVFPMTLGLRIAYFQSLVLGY